MTDFSRCRVTGGKRNRDWRSILYGALLTATLAVMAVSIGLVRLDDAGQRRAAQRSEDLQCLAENVYYEARGEPLAGQYAVAEVTMNRVESKEFPDSVCAVVYARGAFSWTYAEDHPAPYGYEWRRARSVAGTVYDNREAPLVSGALFYHSTRVSPGWAATRSQLVLIGHHLFYL
jgi:spore germination cell wall hydrolase CwlJ-like protein